MDPNKSGQDLEQDLVNKIYSLEENGSTALGPAMAVSVGIAAKAAGSTVLVLTDGLANVGLGALDGVKETPAVYGEIAKLGKDHGVGVSVVSIRGDDIKMEALGVVTAATGGTVDIVDATSLQSKMDSLSAPVVGTNVKATLRSSSNVTICDPSSGAEARGCLTVELASVKADTDVFYTLRVPQDSAKDIFVQCELEWTALDGSVMSRISSRVVQTSVERDTVEKGCNLALAAIAALRECAGLAASNKVEEGRIVLISTMRLLQRGMSTLESQQVFLSFVKQAERLDGFLRELQQRAETEMLLYGKVQNAKNDDYASRNVLQAKILSLSDWKKAK